MWHFWSEPAQRVIIDSLIDAFERKHGDIDVQLTEVQWSDGKAKLMAAFNAGLAPDVVHLGLDWFADFDANRVFAALPDSLSTDGRASRWVVNARALVTNDAATSSAHGFCATDAHNVIKRMLPLIWQHGAPSFYTSLPIQASMNESLVDALWSMRSTLGNQAFIDRSRQLDERLLGGQIRSVYTGSWIADMATARSVRRICWNSWRCTARPATDLFDVFGCEGLPKGGPSCCLDTFPVYWTPSCNQHLRAVCLSGRFGT